MFFGEPIRLLPKADIIKTSPNDFGEGVYQLHLGWLFRARIQLGVKLLPNRVNRLLEIGYGSGILMPELDTRANALFGIDPHEHAAGVTEKLRVNGVNATLKQSKAENIPFEDEYFDRIIAVSSLEFVTDIHAACLQIKRVLAPEGRFVVVTPGHAPILDFGLKLLTGRDAKTTYEHRRERLIPTLLEHFTVARWRKFPPMISQFLPVYNALELVAKTTTPNRGNPLPSEETKVSALNPDTVTEEIVNI